MLFHLRGGYVLKHPLSTLKMHLEHLAYWTSALSLTYLKQAQNTYISLRLGNYPEFHFKSHCLSLLPPTRHRRQDGHFVDMMGCANINTISKKLLATQYIIEDQLFALMLTESCSPQLQPSIMRGSDHILLRKSTVSTECISLSNHCQVKKLSRTIC